MAMRSMWKGAIRFSLVLIPIKIFKATESGEDIKFNQLHGTGSCNGPVGHSNRCKKCGLGVDKEEIIKGYQYAEGQYVIMGDADFAAIKLETDKIIDIVGFVEPSEIPAHHFEGAYFSGPDGPIGEATYALLRDVMKQTGKVALGRVVLRGGREDMVALSPAGKGVMIQKLLFRHEVRQMSDVGALPEAEADAAMLKMAASLVENMATTYSEVDQTDHYHEKLKALLVAKQSGSTIEVAEITKPKPALDIMSALTASLEAAKASGKPKAAKAPKLTVAKGKKKAA